jgi:hypothetical protein
MALVCFMGLSGLVATPHNAFAWLTGLSAFAIPLKKLMVCSLPA